MINGLGLRHLKRHEPTDAEWRSMATALLEGEESLQDSSSEVESLRLRLQEEVSDSKASRKAGAVSGLGQTSVNRTPSRHPGERLPHRDPVGKK